VLALLLVAQVLLGISNVVLGLPLAVAVAHTGGAALLLFVLVGLLMRSSVIAASPESSAAGMPSGHGGPERPSPA
jgi:heme A synthase